MRITKDWKDDFALTTPRLVSQTLMSVTHFDAPLVKFVRTKLLFCPIPLPETSMTHLPTKLVQKLINRSNTHGLLAVVACGAATLAITPAAALAQNDTATFWTHFAPSEDTRLVFVSSSSGRDTNSGLSPNEPVKSLARAYELLRDGHPDWMLLRRGDVWYESMPRPTKSGRAVDERMVIGAYGDSPERPEIRPADGEQGLQATGSEQLKHIAFVGLYIEPAQRSDDSNPVGIRWLAECDDILFEDVSVIGFKDNVILQAYPTSNNLTGIRFNGCVVADAYSTSGHSQGFYVQGVNGLTIQHSVITSNGFNHDLGAEPTIFNHNIYVQNGCSGIVVKDNIIADASSHGLQLRPGGTVENNLFISNPLAMLLGGGSYPEPDGVSGVVKHNLVMYGRDIADNLPRSFGFTISNIDGAQVTNNYFTLNSIGANRDVIAIKNDRELMVKNLDVAFNMILDWHGTLNISEPTGSMVMENVRVHSNAFYRDMTTQDNQNLNKPFIQVFEGVSPSQVLIENNSYSHFNMHDRPFRIGIERTETDEWFDLMEPTGVSNELVSPPPAVGLELYLSDQEINGDFEDFLDHARQLSRSNFDSRFTAARVIQWFESETQSRQFTLVE